MAFSLPYLPHLAIQFAFPSGFTAYVGHEPFRAWTTWVIGLLYRSASEVTEYQALCPVSMTFGNVRSAIIRSHGLVNRHVDPGAGDETFLQGL